MALPNRGLRLLCLCAGVVAASVPAASGGGGLRTYYPVAIIGNGPSALAASALLAGWLPFYRDGCRHPNAPLRNAIQSQLERAARATGRDPIEVSLLELDLRSLAAHVLEAGRSNNPIALLVDSLLHPGADTGYGGPGVTCIDVRYVSERRVEHAIIGDGAAGGSWADMAAGTRTLSPGYWMELPGMRLESQLEDVRGRVDRQLVQQYFTDYSRRFVPRHSMITGRVTEAVPPVEPLTGHWSIRVANASTAIDRSSCETNRESSVDTGQHAEQQMLHIHAEQVVLATGMYRRPKQLPGIQLPTEAARVEVAHRCPHSWPARNATHDQPPRTVLVVGAGLSAADCVLAAMTRGWRVLHVFRSEASRTKLGSKFGGAGGMYADYGDLVERMSASTPGSTDDLSSREYIAFPSTELRSISEDGLCTLSQLREGAIEESLWHQRVDRSRWSCR